ncbi:MAG: alpha/beta hydrolase-fold protein [Olsenella sp.]|jgi:hypothetical protein
MLMERFVVGDARVTLRATGRAGAVPVVYLHVYEGDGGGVWRLLTEAEAAVRGPAATPEGTPGVTPGGTPGGTPTAGPHSPLSLVAIEPASWDDDLTPWSVPAAFRGGHDFGGGARRQLDLLEGEVMPRVEVLLAQGGLAPAFSAVAGYSLAGLFATWAATASDAFSRVASVSGSLWYPGLVERVAAAGPSPRVERAYFSLGEAEPRTRNRVMRPVLEDTRQVAEAFGRAGVKTRLELNPGGHFRDEDLRCARAVGWLLSDGEAGGDRPAAEKDPA